MTNGLALGIDIGGSGIKAAMVDVATGELVGGREVIPTPTIASRDGMRAAVCGLATRVAEPIDPSNDCPWGVAFPGVIKNNVVKTAANLNAELIGATVNDLFGPTNATQDSEGPPSLSMINDADAAGVAEARFGAAAGTTGSVMIVTLGTGIGTALISNGELVANTELGHLLIGGIEAEALASGRVRKAEGLEWIEWGERLNTVLNEYERLLQPDLFVIGGGVSKHLHLYVDSLTVSTELKAAAMGNDAGIIGAALAAEHRV